VKRILMPTKGPGSWAPLLADPLLHWKRGRSAMCLAAAWESAHPQPPPEVVDALQASGIADFDNLQIVAAIPEFSTALPGGATSSQTDLMVLARNEASNVVIAVEGKVDETFGPTLGEKRADASDGQVERLSFLHRRLGLSVPLPNGVRYQLLHRAVAAVLFGAEVHARAAVVLVHSFDDGNAWFGDFAEFARHVGSESRMGAIVRTSLSTDVPLYLGWVTGDKRFTSVDIPAAV